MLELGLKILAKCNLLPRLKSVVLPERALLDKQAT